MKRNITLTVLVVTLVGIIFIGFSWLVNENVKINERIETINENTIELDRSNPDKLADCINKSGQSYINYIEINGIPERSANGIAYRLNKEQWEEADKALEEDKQVCQKQYGD